MELLKEVLSFLDAMRDLTCWETSSWLVEAMGSGRGHGQHVGEVSTLHISVASFPGSKMRRAWEWGYISYTHVRREREGGGTVYPAISNLPESEKWSNSINRVGERIYVFNMTLQGILWDMIYFSSPIFLHAVIIHHPHMQQLLNVMILVLLSWEVGECWAPQKDLSWRTAAIVVSGWLATHKGHAWQLGSGQEVYLFVTVRR